jgi:IS30 family transposase
MIRRYFPKKTNWALISQEQLDKIITKINTRPMKCLGYRTPEVSTPMVKCRNSPTRTCRFLSKNKGLCFR